MVQITFKDDEAILRFPKQLVSSGYVQAFLERLRLEAIVEKSQLTEEQAWELSEEIKQEWWQKNKDKLLKRNKY
ncbi:MAG: hypothetical protein ACE5HO_12535 [bacterium]